jgi:hypothetical protein
VSVGSSRPARRVARAGVTIGCAPLRAVLDAPGFGFGAAGGGLVRVGGRGGLAEQGVVAAPGALVRGLVVVDGVAGPWPTAR